MNKKYLKIVLATMVVTISLLTIGCKNRSAPIDNAKTIKIGYLPLTHALPLFVAAELQKQYTKDINIELVKFGSWTELTDALNTGRIDGASVLVELAMKAKESSIGLKAVALGHTDGNVIIASNKIKSVSDLKGKTVAIPHKLSSHFLLIDQMLRNSGMTLKDINIVEFPPPEMPSALTAGKIDAYCVAEPFGAKAIVLGVGKSLYKSEDLWKHSLCCVLVLNDQFISQKKQLAKSFVALYHKSGKYIDDNRDKTYELTKKYLNVDKKVYDISMQWIKFGNLKITKGDYNDLTKRVKEAGLSNNPPSYSDFVDNVIAQ